MAGEPFNPTGTTQLSGMPNTFAGVDPVPVVSKQSTVSYNVGTANTVGGPATSRGAIAPDTSIAPAQGTGILDLVNKAMAPRLAKMKQDAMFQGMQRAAAGESVDQLRAEQNPILSVFGVDSDVVSGAQMYTSISGVSSVQAELNAAMPDLRKKSAAEVGQISRDMMMKSMAGADPGTAAMMQQQFVEYWPQFLVQHGKEHVAWRKEDFADKAVIASNTGATSLQTLQQGVRNKTVNSAAMDQAKARYLETIETPPGVSEEDWKPITMRSADQLLKDGNFAAYEVLKTSKAYQRLTPEQQDALKAREEPAFQRAAQYDPAYTGDLADKSQLLVSLQQGVSPFTNREALWAHMDALNAENAKTSGGTVPMYDNQDKAQFAAALDAGLERSARSARVQQDKAAAAVYGQDVIDRAFNTTGTAGMEGVPDLDKGVGADRWFSSWMNEGNETKRTIIREKVAGTIAATADAVPPLMKRVLSRSVSAFNADGPLSPDSTEGFKVAAELLQSRNGRAALSRVVGADDAASIEYIVKSGLDPRDPDSLTTLRDLAVRGRGAVVTQDDRDSASASISSATSILPWKDGRLRGLNLSAGAERTVTAIVADKVARYRKAYPGMDDDSITEYAIAHAMDGAEVVNGAYVQKSPFVRDTLTQSQAVGKQYPNLAPELLQAAQRKAALAIFHARGIDDFDAYEAANGQHLGSGIVSLRYVPRDKWGPNAKAIGSNGLVINITPQAVLNNIPLVLKEQEAEQAKKDKFRKELERRQGITPFG